MVYQHHAARQVTSFVTATATHTVDDLPTATSVSYFPLTTTLAIFNVPTNAPDPQYQHFSDGSLITDNFITEFAQDKFRLVVLGLLLMLFLHNTATAISYIRRVKLKSKFLFYMLLGSQLCGPIAIGSLMSPLFVKSASCWVATVVAAIFIVFSYSFLIPGILAVKAYRCLGCPRFVLIVVIVLHLSAIVLFMSDLPNMRAFRKLTGSCGASGNLGRIVIAILLLMAEVLFICLCFLYAVWRSTRYPEARGRISLQMSINRVLSHVSEASDLEKRKAVESRGWWDYVPEKRTDGGHIRKMTADAARTRRAGTVQAMIMRLFGDEDLLDQPKRKPSVHSVKPIAALSISQHDKETNRMSWRNWSKMLKFPSAMKDELGYTAAIAVTCAMAVCVIVAGAFKSTLFGGPLMWVGLSWGLTSILILHNFSRVVRRNEREITLQEPAAWNPYLQSQQDGAVFVSPAKRQSVSSISTASEVAYKHSRASEAAEMEEEIATDPFEDFEPVTTESWQPQRFPRNISERFPRNVSAGSMSVYSNFSTSPAKPKACFEEHKSRSIDVQQTP